MNALLSSATQTMQGQLHGEDRAFDGVSTDTRTIGDGELFVALNGPNFQGVDFIGQAAAKGAAGAVVDALVTDDIAQIKVDDTRIALGELGAAWRTQQAATVIGVTGSNGKTTLKEMIAACLQQVAPTLATEGNLNNDIGMPLMLCRIEPEHQFAVIEMGANHCGEIAYLTALASPDVVVITNAGSAHLEGFGSLQGVAHGKGEILQDGKRPDAAILNADDAYYDYWASLVTDINVLSFGLDASADVYASDIHQRSDASTFRLHLREQSLEVNLPLAGLHNVRNACAAAAVALALGLSADDIADGLAAVRTVAGRLQPIVGVSGARVFDDSYNANPVSVVAAAEFMASLEGENWLVLGDMFELGDEAVQLHRDVGTAIRDSSVKRLFGVGELTRHAVDAFGNRGNWFASIEDLIAHVTRDLRSDVNVLIKGSRGMRMERVVDALRVPTELRREA